MAGNELKSSFEHLKDRLSHRMHVLITDTVEEMHIHTHTYIYTQTHTHTQIHTYMYTYTHKHTQMYTPDSHTHQYAHNTYTQVSHLVIQDIMCMTSS